VTYASGCLFRAIYCLLQVLFAINDQYWMNEKGALALADGFARSPAHLKERVKGAFSQLDSSGESIDAAIGMLREVVGECEAWVANPI
jgi:hypothetical protein